jgi:hypothetical protein
MKRSFGTNTKLSVAAKASPERIYLEKFCA